MEGAVAGFEGRTLGAGQLTVGVIQGRCGQAGVQPGEGVPQPTLQYHLTVVVALGAGRVWGDVRPVGHLPAEARQPVKATCSTSASV